MKRVTRTGGLLLLVLLHLACGGTRLAYRPRYAVVTRVPLPQAAWSVATDGSCWWVLGDHGWWARVTDPAFRCPVPLQPAQPLYRPAPARCQAGQVVAMPPAAWSTVTAARWDGGRIAVVTDSDLQLLDPVSATLHPVTKVAAPDFLVTAGTGIWWFRVHDRLVCTATGRQCWGPVPDGLGPRAVYHWAPPWLCWARPRVKDRRLTLDVSCDRLAANRCTPHRTHREMAWQVPGSWYLDDLQRYPRVVGVTRADHTIWMWAGAWLSRWDLEWARKAWDLDLGARPAVPPVTDGNRLVMALVSGLVVAYHAGNGNRLWLTDLGEPAVAAYHIRSPGATPGLLALVTLTGQGRVLNLKNGKIVWRSDAAPVLSLFGHGNLLVWSTQTPELVFARVTWQPVLTP